MATASARLEAPNLLKMDVMWNLTVCSEIFSSPAICLFPMPAANRFSTSASRGDSCCPPECGVFGADGIFGPGVEFDSDDDSSKTSGRTERRTSGWTTNRPDAAAITAA